MDENELDTTLERLPDVVTNEELLVGAQEFGDGTVANESTLRHEEHIMWDDALIEVARKRLKFMNMLRGAGLVRDVGGLGTILSQYERMGDMTEAEVNMDGMVMSQEDRLTFDQVGVPIPIFQKDFRLGKRQLLASRRRGEPLSTSAIRIATRIVSDKIEDHAYNGIPGLVVDGKQVYGITNHPNRNTKQFANAWTANNADITGDVEDMLEAMLADNRYGPFVLLVARNLWVKIQTDYTYGAGGQGGGSVHTRTIKERIEAYEDISSVECGDYLDDNEVVLLSLTDDTIDLAVAQDIVNIEWSTNPMQTIYKVYGAMAVRIKADRNGSCGIVHGAP